jgi:hypothetical protein|nr:MAG TPA: hypothetical protein [Caudoviricetes sp.]
MQDVLTYEAWLDAVCHICNSLLKANVSVTGNNEFKVVATKYSWFTFVDSERIHYVYDKGWEPAWGATELMRMIIDEWEQLLIDEDGRYGHR